MLAAQYVNPTLDGRKTRQFGATTVQDEYELEDMPADRLTAEDLQELYEEQMRLLACPSCGEEAFMD